MKSEDIRIPLMLIFFSLVCFALAFTLGSCSTLNVEAEKSFVVNVKQDPCDFRVVIDGTERFHGWSKTIKCAFNVAPGVTP